MVETVVGSSGEGCGGVAVGGVVVVGGVGGVGGFGGFGFGAWSGFGFGLGCAFGFGFGADFAAGGAADLCCGVTATVRDASCEVLAVAVDDWLSLGATKRAFAATTTCTRRAGRVLTIVRRADALAGRSTVSVPWECPCNDPVVCDVAAGDGGAAEAPPAPGAGVTVGAVATATAVEGFECTTGRAAM